MSENVLGSIISQSIASDSQIKFLKAFNSLIKSITNNENEYCYTYNCTI